jgi:16S rRNA (guanine966-N2)-methyltransferase
VRIVAGRFRGRALASPPDDSIRPTSDRVRESVFNILSSRLGPDLGGARVLDLFAGTGALGLEALSRGASYTMFVDSGIAARALIRDHIEGFGIGGRTKLLKRDATALGAIERFKPFNLVFLDPPYAKGLGEKALISARDGGWIVPGATCVFEEKKDVVVDLPDGFALDDERAYGDTTIRFLSFGDVAD